MSNSGKETMEKPLVGMVMGSSSDWDTMQHAAAILKQFLAAGGK